MPEVRQEAETIAEIDPLAQPPVQPAQRAETPITSPEPTEQDRAREAERGRINGIRKACRVGRMTLEFEQRLIDEGVHLERAQDMVFEEMRKRGGDDRGPQNTAAPVRLGEDPTVHVRAGIAEALCHRLAGDLKTKTGEPYFPLTDKGRQYRGMTLMDVARAYLHGLGIRTSGMSKHEIAGVALGLTGQRAGMHTTSDFSNLLADVANKTLRAAYAEQPQTFRPIVRVVTLPDFKVANRVQLGDAPALLEVGQNGEITQGTISDGKETLQLTTYARMFAITRKALINDDTDAFSRVPMMFGRKSRVLESNLVWAQITGNPTMGDGNALFSAAHGNLETDGDHITVDSLARARTAMRNQTSLDGDYLNLSPAYLIVPAALETVADQFVTVITPALAGSVNPFSGRLQVIAEPRLDADSVTAWYLAASVSDVDIIELAYLEGEEGPRVESQIGFDIEGLKIKCSLDVAAKVIDWRGLHKDPGDLASERIGPVRRRAGPALSTTGYGEPLPAPRRECDMAKTYVQAGKVITWTNATGSDVASGDVVVVGNILGVALVDIANNASGSVGIRGVYTCPKVSGAVIAQGESLSWDVSAGAFDDNLASPATGDVTGPPATAAEAAGNGVTEIDVLFTGVPGTVN